MINTKQDLTQLLQEHHELALKPIKTEADLQRLLELDGEIQVACAIEGVHLIRTD